MIEPLRKFWLENEKGERKPLNGEEGVFFLKPTGLGVELDNSFGRAGNAFFLTETVDPFTQSSMGGDLVFDMPRPHDLYTSFVNWVLQAKELTLGYMPTTTAYRRRISVVSLKKDEPDRPVAITIPFTFVALTPWYTNDDEQFDIDVDVDGGFRVSDDDEEEGLSRLWDETSVCEWYRLVDVDYLTTEILVQPNGQIESSFSLRFQGVLIEPIIEIIGAETNREYGRAAISESFSGDDVLEYPTSQLDSYIRKVRNGVTIDLLNRLDLSYEVFPRLPTTEPVRLVIASDGKLNGNLFIRVQRYMAGV